MQGGDVTFRLQSHSRLRLQQQWVDRSSVDVRNMQTNTVVMGGWTTMGNNEEDIPKQGSTVGASVHQALWHAPRHQAQLASLEIWW